MPSSVEHEKMFYNLRASLDLTLLQTTDTINKQTEGKDLLWFIWTNVTILNFYNQIYILFVFFISYMFHWIILFHQSCCLLNTHIHI